MGKGRVTHDVKTRKIAKGEVIERGRKNVENSKTGRGRERERKKREAINR